MQLAMTPWASSARTSSGAVSDTWAFATSPRHSCKASSSGGPSPVQWWRLLRATKQECRYHRWQKAICEPNAPHGPSPFLSKQLRQPRPGCPIRREFVWVFLGPAQLGPHCPSGLPLAPRSLGCRRDQFTETAVDRSRVDPAGVQFHRIDPPARVLYRGTHVREPTW
jgi:hypothetical protein